MSSISERNPVNPLHEGIYQRVSDWLEKHDRTVRWLAGRCRIPYTTLNSQMKRRSFSLETVDALTRALGVSMAWLLYGDEPEQGGVAPVGGRRMDELRDFLVGALEIIAPETLAAEADPSAEDAERDRAAAALEQFHNHKAESGSGERRVS